MSEAVMAPEIIEKLVTFITAGFALAAALAWNEAVQGWLKNQPLLTDYGPWAYAVAVTAIAVLATVWMGSFAKKFK